MRNRSRKPKLPDPNQVAFGIVQLISGEADAIKPVEREKDPAAVALGRKGGLKGGKARAKAMTKKQRVESAKKAAKARWKKDKDKV
jgi:hypothetical protein